MSLSGPISRIESTGNGLLKETTRLVQSNNRLHKSGLAVAEGIHLAQWVLTQSSLTVQALWLPDSMAINPQWQALADHLGSGERAIGHTYLLTDALYAKLSPMPSSPGPLIIFQVPPHEEMPDLSRDVVLLDGIQDPGNVGTILRNAAAAGVQQIALCENTAWPWQHKTLRAGMGAHSRLKFFTTQAVVQALQQHPGACVRTTTLAPGSRSLFHCDLRIPGVWVFGNEGAGVSNAWLELTTERINIDQTDWVESLNVASSSAICLFEQRRQRHNTTG